MIYFTFLNAILLSAVAAYYSVIGLASIFPGSFWPVVLMGTVLESSKLVTTSWLYRNWKTAPFIMKSYLTSAVAILMLITSMGIFGYLSKAHLEHTADVGPLADKVAILDEKIKTLKDNIDANKKSLQQMDAAVDNVMGRTDDARGAERAVQIRKSQQKERAQIAEDISKSQKEVTKLTDEKAPLANELRKAESDFGPIKYVAELIYGSGDKDIIDKAVRLVIILIMIVFDPLAVLLLVAGNISLSQKEKEKEENLLDLLQKRVKDNKTVLNAFPEPAQEAQTTETPNVKPEEPKESLLPEEPKQTVEVPKENLIVIDEASGESIPSLVPHVVETHHVPGIYSIETVHVPAKKLEPKYDYDEALSFKEKENK